MKRRLLYLIGKFIQRVFTPIERFFGGIAFYGMNLWDKNCDCQKCRDRARCPECLEERPDDERVKAGMKCSYCAYGGGEREQEQEA